jgi:D-inositol-3-phosphate glycosyltransferase
MTQLRLAILSMHTSPLTQPGTGDGGGMNVYVRELAAALARQGVECDVFTRAEAATVPAVVAVEPGFRVHHVPAGPLGPVPKESLPDLVPAWTAGVSSRLDRMAGSGRPVTAIHANYWLSGLAGHTLKHALNVPLVVTFHTLDRVKADASPEELSVFEPARRALAEAEIVGCADTVLASCRVEADQLIDLYRAEQERIAIVAPGVDHCIFGPGNKRQARRAVGLDADTPVILFAGRIQPLKGLCVAVEALAEVRSTGEPGSRAASASLVVIGGPSGPHGEEDLARVRDLIRRQDLQGAVRFLAPQRHEVLSTYYRAADLCVVPSHSESFGLVALEAAACGIPVVASAVGGLTTLVEHGRTGYLVEGRDPGDYAKPIVDIVSDPDWAAELGSAAAELARAYTWRAAAMQLREAVDAMTSSALVACG